MTDNNTALVKHIDIQDIGFDLPKELNTPQSLKFFEDQVFIAYGDVNEAYNLAKDGYTRLAYHTYMLLEHNLWRHHKLPDGEQMFGTQEEYLEHLAAHSIRGFAISTVKGFNTSIRMAIQLGMSRERIESVGIHIINEVSKLVEKDYKTGKPLRLKDGELPPDRELNEYILEAINTIAADNSRPDIILRPKDVKAELNRLLAPNRPAINFTRYPGQAMNTIRWEYELFDEEGRMTPSRFGNLYIQWTDDPPAAVIEKFFQMIRVNLGNE